MELLNLCEEGVKHSFTERVPPDPGGMGSPCSGAGDRGGAGRAGRSSCKWASVRSPSEQQVPVHPPHSWPVGSPPPFAKLAASGKEVKSSGDSGELFKMRGMIAWNVGHSHWGSSHHFVP